MAPYLHSFEKLVAGAARRVGSMAASKAACKAVRDASGLGSIIEWDVEDACVAAIDMLEYRARLGGRLLGGMEAVAGGVEEGGDVEAPPARKKRNFNKWSALAVPFSSAEHQYHAAAPSCWKRYGASGKCKQRWSVPIPSGAALEPFSVGYTERKCRENGCPAGLRLLEPLPSESQMLLLAGIEPFSVYETLEGHVEDHAPLFLSPEECRNLTMTEIAAREKAAMKDLPDDAKRSWERKRSLNLPADLTAKLKDKVKEPLRRSNMIRNELEQSAESAGRAGSSSANAELSILAADDVWKRRARYARGGSGAERVRLSRDILDLWVPFRVRPANFEIHRPWGILFHFADDPESKSHYYAWTTLSMVRSAHWWMEVNRTVRDGVGKLYVTFDGNFDVIASKKGGRVVVQGLEEVGETASVSPAVLADFSAEDVLPPGSDDEEVKTQTEAAMKSVEGWVNILICTDRKRVGQNGNAVTSAVPLCVLVARSENSTAILAAVAAFTKLVQNEYADFYESVIVPYVRADNGSGVRKAAREILQACPANETVGRTPGGCYVHEVMKASEGKATWASQFGQLRRKWVASGMEEELGADFSTAYSAWIRAGQRCPTLAHFRLFGDVLARVAESAGAVRSAAAFRLKFGPTRLPFHSSAVGISGVPSHQQSVESLQAVFDNRVYGRGMLSHKQYFENVTGNAHRLASVMPQTASDMRVTGLVPSSQMVQRAQDYVRGGGLAVFHEGKLCLPSATIAWKLDGLADESGAAGCFMLAVKTALDGLQGDFSAFLSARECASADVRGAAQALRLFGTMYLSIHIVSLEQGIELLTCTCPGFWGQSVCWHKAAAIERANGTINLGARLGSFPLPFEAARHFLGTNKPCGRSVARPGMQDTPKRRRFTSKASDVCVPAASDPYKHATRATFWTAADLVKSFTEKCEATRPRGVEQMAFFLGTLNHELSEPGNHVHFEITHLLFPPQTVAAQSVVPDMAFVSSAIEVEKNCDPEKWGTLQLLGWVHDHHTLDADPTIDIDCWSQFLFQQDNRFFAMVITGIRKKAGSRSEARQRTYDRRSWNTWFQLMPKAIEHMERLSKSSMSTEQRHERLREAMGVLCPLSDYVRPLADCEHVHVSITVTNEWHTKVVQPTNYLAD
jgi:hypothetical protein